MRSLLLPRVLLLLLMLVGLTLSGISQTLSVSGTVTDAEDGAPLAGVSITNRTLRIGAFSDEQGNYSIDISGRAEVGQEIALEFSLGASPEIRQIILKAGDNKLDVQLGGAEFTTDDVVITAAKGLEQSQSDVTVSIEVIKPRFVELQAQPTVDKVITQIPGVDNQDGQINIRGSSGYAFGVGSRVMVAMDGLPLLTGDAGLASLDLIPVDNIQQIEVMKGASSVLYGSSALGGVINVITADPGDQPKTTLRVRGSAYGTPGNPALDWNGSATTYAGSAHAFHSRKIGDVALTLQGNFIKDQGYRQGTDREEYRGLAMVKYSPKSIPGLTIGLNTSVSVDSSSSTLYWGSYLPDTIEVNGRDSIVGGGLTPTLEDGAYRRQVASFVALDPSVRYVTDNGQMFWYRGRFLRNSNQNNTGQSSQNAIIYNDFLFQTLLWDRVNWSVGATHSYATINGDSLYGGTYIFEGDTINSNGRHTSNSLGLYTQFDAQFGKLNTNLGIRYETVQIDDQARQSLPVFRAGLNYEIRKGTNVRTSFGQAFRVPSIAERFANTTGGGVIVEPNPAILSERGYSAEVGFRQGFLAKRSGFQFKGFVDLAGFMMRYDDMVEFGISRLVITPDFNFNALFSSVNVADARITGIEFNQTFMMQAKKFRASISGGITTLDPINLNNVSADSLMNLQDIALEQDQTGQQNIGAVLVELNTKIDQPRALKYRSRHTIRYSLSLGYDAVTLTTNLRYKSIPQAIDQYLYLVVGELATFQERYTTAEPYWDYVFGTPQNGLTRGEQLELDRQLAEGKLRGDLVMDFILAWDINDKMTLSFNLDNAFNREFLIIPGTLGPQRQFTLQYAWRL